MSLPRYPEYKDSGVAWLGEVPGHWEVKRLKNLATIQNGSDYKHIQADSEGYPVIGSGGEFARAREYLYEGESVLLGRKGTIDRPLYINGAFWPVDTMFYTMIKQETCAKYLYYCALTIRFDLYSTSTALPSMTQADLSNIHFAVPDFEEQTAIANFLDRETAKIDALIAEQEKLIALLAEKRQATISHAVTKGLNPDAPMKDSGVAWLGEVPGHWSVKQIRHFAEILRGKFTHRPRNDPAFYDGDYPFVQTGDITSAERYITTFKQTLNQRGTDVSKEFPKGTLVMAIAANIGDVAILDFPAYFPDSIVGLVPQSDINLLFLFYLMMAMKGPMIQTATISTQMNLNVDQISSLIAGYPPIQEQVAIVSFLDAETTRVDALTAEATRAIALLKERRTALISAAVTGKIDVRTQLA